MNTTIKNVMPPLHKIARIEDKRTGLFLGGNRISLIPNGGSTCATFPVRRSMTFSGLQ